MYLSFSVMDAQIYRENKSLLKSAHTWLLIYQRARVRHLWVACGGWLRFKDHSAQFERRYKVPGWILPRFDRIYRLIGSHDARTNLDIHHTAEEVFMISELEGFFFQEAGDILIAAANKELEKGCFRETWVGPR
jgi:hypothetical protein